MNSNTQKQRKDIGRIILAGGTVEDIQKLIPEFPDSPTCEYFIDIWGYSKNTAKQYLQKLRKSTEAAQKNEAEEETFANEEVVVKEEAAEEAPQINEEVKTDGCLIMSQNVDVNNLLIDTCALPHRTCLNLIEEAKQVTFIYSTLVEIDKLQRNNNIRTSFAEYCKKIIMQREKYLLSTFTGLNDEKYVDNILLQYMQILPIQIRPTLLTADKVLANKACALGLEVILFVLDHSNGGCNIKKKQGKGDGLYGKKLGQGLWIFKQNGKLYLESKSTYKVQIMHQGQVFDYNGICEVKEGDRITVFVKCKGVISKQFFEVKM